jgi:hypothetical protein
LRESLSSVSPIATILALARKGSFDLDHGKFKGDLLLLDGASSFLFKFISDNGNLRSTRAAIFTLRNVALLDATKFAENILNILLCYLARNVCKLNGVEILNLLLRLYLFFRQFLSAESSHIESLFLFLARVGSVIFP